MTTVSKSVLEIEQLDANNIEAQNINEVRYVGAPSSNTFTTIQSALNDLAGPGQIHILNSYDESKEAWPVEIDYAVDVHGAAHSEPIVLPSGANGFQINYVDGLTTSASIHNMKIVGGNDQITINGENNVTLQNLMLLQPGNDGIVIQNWTGGDRTTYNSYYSNVYIYEPSRYAIHIKPDSGPFNSLFSGIYCDGNSSGTHAVFVDAGISAVTFQSCTFQKFNQEAVKFTGTSGAGSAAFRDCYFEQNGLASTNPYDMYISTGAGIATMPIDGCYFNGFDDMDGSLNLKSGDNIFVTNCHWNGYERSLEGRWIISDDPGVNDLNVDFTSCSTDGAEAYFFKTGRPQGTRTRVNGIIWNDDLTTINGQYKGDRGFDSGATTGNRPWTFCIWDGTNWNPVTYGTTF